MRRDMQLVLERWGRWAASEEYCSMVDWPSMSVVPQRVTASGKPGCSDEDGAAIDTCIAHMSMVCPHDDLLVLGLRFIGGFSTRSIAESVNRSHISVRTSLRASEAFLEGALVLQGIRLDMDPEVALPEKVVCAQKHVLWL
ncbi:antitermination protein Q [Salmonella enterica subsp. enterica serovar Java]|nr:antitermination protein Q [Salmonella enterica subsp. enterica serovar Lisboa]EAZ1705806.1 antitermination protein Q [Salmonella enterica]EBV4143844.1 antitermination protein Q [Salmonella enterica subsp. enterica serovar Benin]EBX3198540.1 antitermination protein Q [Salmonella enterica subsp. enterica serovar Abony]EDW4641445.1 antitermination protein Q [Salmonella enterica subsp. enterica serovar Java]EHY6446180.1 antitermination protein Q [Salmonella enterica subsp. enterica serovar Ente